MKTIKIKSHDIQIYSDIDDTPIGRYNQFNLYMLADSDVGSSMESVNARLSRMDAFLAAGDIKKARVERQNLQVTFYSTFNKLNYAQRAFCCLIYKINDDRFDDISDEGINTMIERLDKIGITHKEIYEVVRSQKKKLMDALRMYFPTRFGSSTKLQYTRNLKKLLLTQNQAIQDTDQYSEEMENQYRANILSLINPEVVLGHKDSVFVRTEVLHAELYSILESNGINRPEELSLLRFYGLLDQREKSKPKTSKPVNSNGRYAKI